MKAKRFVRWALYIASSLVLLAGLAPAFAFADGVLTVSAPPPSGGSSALRVQDDSVGGTVAAAIGSTFFEDLQSAIDQAENGDTIVMQANRFGGISIAGKDIVLDLNGHTLIDTDATGITLLASNANVTVRDSTAIAGDVRGRIVKPGGGARYNVNGTYVVRKVDAVQVMGGSFTLESGGIEDFGEGSSAVRLDNAAFTLGVPGADDSLAKVHGSVQSEWGIKMDNSGNGNKPITINSGTVIGGNGILAYGELKVNGGSISATGLDVESLPELRYGVAVEAHGSVTVNGGTLASAITNTVEMKDGASITVYEGNFTCAQGCFPIIPSTGRVKLAGGCYSAPPLADEDALWVAGPDGFDLVYEGGCYRFGTAAGPSITTKDLGDAYSNTPIIDVQLAAYPAAASYEIVAGNLPEGVTMTDAGLVSGTPQQQGSGNVAIVAVDTLGKRGPVREFTWEVMGAYVGPTITTDELPPANPSHYYFCKLEGEGIGGVTFSFPDGGYTAPGANNHLRLRGNYLTSNQINAGTFTVRATDGLGNSVDKEFTVKGVPAAIGDVLYGSLQEAIDSAEKGDVVELLTGEHAESVTVGKGQSITLYLAQTSGLAGLLAAEGPTIINRGDLTIAGYGYISSKVAGQPALVTESGARTEIRIESNNTASAWGTDYPLIVSRGTTVVSGPSDPYYKSYFTSDSKTAPVILCEGEGSSVDLRGAVVKGGLYGVQVDDGGSARLNRYCVVTGQAAGGAGSLVAGSLVVDGAYFGAANTNTASNAGDGTRVTPTGENVACIALAGSYDAAMRPNSVSILRGTFASWGSVVPVIAATGADLAGMPTETVNIEGGSFMRYPSAGASVVRAAYPVNGKLAGVARYGSAPVVEGTAYVVNEAVPVITVPDGPISLVRGEETSVKLDASGTRPMSWFLVGNTLPPGLELSRDGIVSGVPTELGEFGVIVSASNKAGMSEYADITFSVGKNAADIEADERAERERAEADLANATVTVANATYTGVGLTPAVTVKSKGGKALSANTDFTLSFKDNVKAGRATVTVTGRGTYNGSKTVSFEIAKAPSAALGKAVSVKAKKKAVKAAKVKKKAQVISGAVKVTFAAAATEGSTVSFAKVKKGSAKQLTKVNKKTGKITVKKGTKKGTYTVKVRVTVSNANYVGAFSKTVKAKVRVK